jgi:glyoxylase-like metal-dependent hydrolase (beta-lactamase superfamily II)
MLDRMTTRRALIRDLGTGGLAVTIFALITLAANGDDAEESAAGSAKAPPGEGTAADGVTWERVNLGFVSAYVLARRGEAAIVDTGIPGSEGDIETSLGILGLDWSDVGTVIVTHLHNDHQGSLPAVMNLASGATGYAGSADIAGITSPRKLIGVGDGDRVFDLAIIDTPGHTPGHISVLDERGGLLVAGDALTGKDGGVAGANPQFTADMSVAGESIKKLAGFTYGTVVLGHGEPVVGNASQLVAELAAQL